jgi:hypothetical protein
MLAYTHTHYVRELTAVNNEPSTSRSVAVTGYRFYTCVALADASTGTLLYIATGGCILYNV